jgi:hypothetical protein
MASRQHQVPSFIKDGENSLGDGNTTAAREGADMAVWIMRRLQSLPARDSPWPAPQPPPKLELCRHQ